jgi:hypothetical protein
MWLLAAWLKMELYELTNFRPRACSGSPQLRLITLPSLCWTAYRTASARC